ncbi:MAG: hypothetical protein ACRDOY_03920 [Nocardioidaceae bacterium]
MSSHATSTGLIVYTRCVCGALQVRLQHTLAGSLLLVRGSQRGRWGLREDPRVPCQS